MTKVRALIPAHPEQIKLFYGFIYTKFTTAYFCDCIISHFWILYSFFFL